MRIKKKDTEMLRIIKENIQLLQVPVIASAWWATCMNCLTIVKAKMLCKALLNARSAVGPGTLVAQFFSHKVLIVSLVELALCTSHAST